MSPAPTLALRLQRLFLSGLLTLLPIWLTWVVVKFVFVLLTDVSRPWVAPLAHEIAAAFPGSLGWVNAGSVQAAIALAATLALILAVGWLARRMIGQRLLAWLEALVQRIPLANIIYSSARKLLDILQTKPDGTQRVVLIDFPHSQMKAVGFVTRVIREHGTGRELAAVYVPTTPNPTSGFFLMMPRAETIELDMSVDTALKYIVSMGVVSPADLASQETATHAAAQAAGADAGDGGQDSFKASGRGQ